MNRCAKCKKPIGTVTFDFVKREVRTECDCPPKKAA